MFLKPICAGAAVAAYALLAGCSGLSQSSPGASALPQLQVRQAVPKPYKTLYSFKGDPDGADPTAGLLKRNGTLYGTTTFGGSGNFGAVIKITTSGTESVLHSFAGGSDGAYPEAGLINVNGTLYGTTADGGTNNLGAVFKITAAGAESVLYSFAGGSDGKIPVARLLAVGTSLYGTTEYGGDLSCNCGTVFKVTTSGTESVLHSFVAGKSDGAYPLAGLIDVGGVLYGTTFEGGPNSGTVFKITTAGAEGLVYGFAGGSDGLGPLDTLLNVNGTLYGTTQIGGGANNAGTVFKVTTAGQETVLYSFSGLPDGAFPAAGLSNVNGTLYGTTKAGGLTGCGFYGCGTIFKVTTSGTETVLHSFASSSDGTIPLGGLVNLNGTLYGTTSSGGASGAGTVFSTGP
jgi:uncharacterized repeat protein (TIGR03803 family)